LRRPIIAGNWKMNKTVQEALDLVSALKEPVRGAAAEVVVCPPYTALYPVKQALAGSDIGLGAQDVFWKKSGAYTGKVSPVMLADVGCAYVIVGHSEARGRFGTAEEGMTDDLLRVFGDGDASVNLKARAVQEHAMTPIICCGELLAERKAGWTDEVVSSQIKGALAGMSAEQVASAVIAYEPVWAIGTGEVCAADEADRVCGVIRDVVRQLHGDSVAESIRIQYGGSVKPDNAAELLAKPNIDGALVGGASLKASDFVAIVRAAG
jgi:triosephosphate isomerase